VVHAEEVEMRLVPGLLAAVVYRAPWHPLAEPLAERAERLLHHQAAPGQRLLLGSLAFHILWRGHVDRLMRIVLRIDALCAEPLAPPATQMRWWGVGILVKTLLGQTDSAGQDAQRALALVETEPTVAAQRAGVHLLQMIIALSRVDAAGARHHMQQAAQALHPDNAVGRTTLEHQTGMLALLEDDGPTALRVMRASVASASASGFPMREHIALIANALAAAHSGEPAEAERLLTAVFAHPFHAICRWHHWVGGCVAAYAAHRRGDEAQAVACLRDALAVARECGFRHGPMLYCCGEMMAQLAALALAHDIEPAVARDLVLRNGLKAPAQADARWPWAVRLHALGPLSIERSDGPLPASRKESRRLLELAALLVAHGQTPAPLETLADTLWPDAEGDAARNALDNALHRLRKLLGGEDRVLLRHGALSLNPQHCWSGVAALDRLLNALDQSAIDATPALVAAVRKLYRAPLLPEETLAGVATRRSMLHLRVQRSLRSAAQRLAAAGMAAAAAEAAAACQSLPDV
jgi:LuxR family transcriptional regulator, maltose regulon positive regulatory protein